MINISEATSQDIPAIIEIAERTWWPSYSNILSADQIRYMLDTIYSPALIKEQISGGSQTYMVLKDDDSPKAFASFSKRMEESGVYKLHKLYVLPETQGKGYGKILIQHVKERLSQKGIHILDLNVNRFNRAKNFYERIGFQILREEDIPVGPYWMNDFVMRLEF